MTEDDEDTLRELLELPDEPITGVVWGPLHEAYAPAPADVVGEWDCQSSAVDQGAGVRAATTNPTSRSAALRTNRAVVSWRRWVLVESVSTRVPA